MLLIKYENVFLIKKIFSNSINAEIGLYYK
jgi:hypothetical protein